MEQKTPRDRPVEEVEVTEAMLTAALQTMEEHRFSSMEGYDLLAALPAAYRAMVQAAKEKEQ